MRRVSAVLVLSAVLAGLAAAVAGAVDPVRVSGLEGEGHQRILFEFPEAAGREDLGLSTELISGVALATFSRPVALDLDAVRAAAGARAPLARLDPDGRTLRLALRGDVRLHVSRSDNQIALDLVDADVAGDPADVVSPNEAKRLRAEAEARARSESAARRASLGQPALPLNVRSAQAADYTRLQFEWSETVGHALQTRKGGVDVVFDRDAAPDLARLRVEAPRGLRDAVTKRENGRLTVSLDLEPGWIARSWADETSVIVDLAPEPEPEPEPTPEPERPEPDPAPEAEVRSAAATPPEPTEAADPEHDHAATPPSDPTDGPAERTSEPTTGSAAEASSVTDASPEGGASSEPGVSAPSDAADERVDPAPPGGVVRAKVTPSGGDVRVVFDWAAPVGAVAFRRADALWIAFDSPATLDLAELRRSGDRFVRSVETVMGEDFTAVRIVSPAAAQLSAAVNGSRWTFTLSEAVADPPEAIAIERIADGGAPPRLLARLKNATSVVSLADPVVGDALIVVFSGGPPQGSPAARRFLEASVLPSAHGMAIETSADDVTAHITPDGVSIDRPDGLALTARVTVAGSERSQAAATATPGFIDFAGWSGPADAFVDRHDAAALAFAAPDATPEDGLALARLLVGHELAGEALGVLQEIIVREPTFETDARFLALRGASNAMLRRDAEAERDFSAPALQRDSAAALWRGLLAARREDWREARRQFEAGSDAYYVLRSDWRGRFRAAFAETALALNDLGAAKQAIDEVRAEEASPEIAALVGLAEARYFSMTGEDDRAIELLTGLETSGVEPVEVPAAFLKIKLRQARDEVDPDQAIEALEALRLRWRGDRGELEIARGLGAMYVAKSDYRGGLSIMRAAATRFPDDPVARRLGSDMIEIFRRLYLEGEAEAMDPVQALALWYEFNDLTPIGAEGDRMIRRLADRLIEFDLLTQAAELLRHQVDNRLRGLTKAEVAADLAAVYLQDRLAEDALNTLRSSRTAELSPELNIERRLLEARALSDLGRHDHALELIARDVSPAAQRLKAEIAWRQKDWGRVGPLADAAAGRAWTAAGPLAGEIEALVLRAAIAYSLAADDEGLARLVARYDDKMKDGVEASAWRLVTDKSDTDGIQLRDLARRLANVETLDAFLADYRARRDASEAAEAVDGENAGAVAVGAATPESAEPQ